MSSDPPLNTHDAKKQASNTHASSFSDKTLSASWEYQMQKLRRKRMAGYVRESDTSLADSTTIESAAKAIREYGFKQGYIYEPQHEYMEAISAATYAYYDRPRLMDMLKAAERHEFDVLVVTEIRALSRRGAGEVIIIYEMLQKYGIELESLARKYGEDDMARFILLWEAEYAKIERQTILTRMARGKKDRIEIGKALNGHKQAGYGHIFIDNAREQKATYGLDTHFVWWDELGKGYSPVDVVRNMKDLALQGKSVRAIAMILTELGIPNPEYGQVRKGKEVEPVWRWGTVYRILTDPRIMGVIYANRYQMVDGKRVVRPQNQQTRLPDVPPIITPAEYEAVQLQLKINKEDSPRNNRQPKEKWGLFMNGYLRCGICGGSMVLRYHNNPQKYPCPDYQCWKKTGGSGIKENHSVCISQHIIDNEGWGYAVSVLRNPDLVRERVELKHQELLKQKREMVDPVEVQETLDNLQTQITNLFKLGQFATDDDTIKQLAADMNELEAQKRQIKALLLDMEEEANNYARLQEEVADFEVWMESRRKLLDDPDYEPTWEEKRRAIRSLGIRGTVYPVNGDWPFRRQFDLAPPEIMKLLDKNYDPHD